jgi:hypothetical protein
MVIMYVIRNISAVRLGHCSCHGYGQHQLNENHFGPLQKSKHFTSIHNPVHYIGISY